MFMKVCKDGILVKSKIFINFRKKDFKIKYNIKNSSKIDISIEIYDSGLWFIKVYIIYKSLNIYKMI